MVLVGIGGAAGALLRYVISENMKPVTFRKGIIFPIATGFINISGSLLLGILYGFSAQGNLSGQLWLLLGIGFCGGYTTFSTFGKEVIDLVLDKYWQLACWYIVISMLLSIFTAWIGMYLVHIFSNL